MRQHLRVVDETLVSELKVKAKQSPRKRAHHTFHEPQDRVQRMVNVMSVGSYVVPHKHSEPNKVEHFVILEGKVACVSHQDDGGVAEVVVLNHDGPIYSVDIRPDTYHTFVCVSDTAVLMEFIEGPYDPQTHKKMAPFAPPEDSPEAYQYLQSLYKLVSN
jgi:cupin fold WbuC family metalloprotein